MNTKQIISLFLYVLDVSLCLILIKRKKAHGYTATKPFLMPLLLAVYFCFLPEGLRGVNHQNFVALALGFHTAGDILLLFPRNKSKKMFYLGMVSFFVGHVFYSLWFFKADLVHSRKAVVIAVVICLFLQYLLYRLLVLGPRKYAPKLVPYSVGLASVMISISSTFGGAPVYATLVPLLGISLFSFSDFCILRRLVRLPLFGQMVVMSTYIAGQTLIVTGILLLQIC